MRRDRFYLPQIFLRAFFFQVRMALPVVELYALFLERRPEEKERVEQARLLEAKVCCVA